MTPILSSLEGMATMYMASQQGPHTAQSIRDIIAQLRGTPMFSGKIEDEEAEKLARLIEEKYGISMGLGAIVVDKEDCPPWLDDSRINGEIGDFYWSRYRKLLSLKGLPKSVIDATDEVTDRVLNRLGNPRNMSPWSRRGMVVGHVQSGKTANYTGLICKAADAGYRLIVVIAGIHNNLRNQTATLEMPFWLFMGPLAIGATLLSIETLATFAHTWKRGRPEDKHTTLT